MMAESGVKAGKNPSLPARRLKSSSSPYMKKAGENPPKRSQSARSTRRKQPQTTSTERSLSGARLPYPALPTSAEDGNLVSRANALQNSVQSVVLRRQDARFGVPSADRVRPPQIPAPGLRRANANIRSNAPSRTIVSGLRKRR